MRLDARCSLEAEHDHDRRLESLLVEDDLEARARDLWELVVAHDELNPLPDQGITSPLRTFSNWTRLTTCSITWPSTTT